MSASEDADSPNEFSHVPERLRGLVDLSYNLWWSWHPEAKVLFKSLNKQAWAESHHNPVRMLRDIPPEFLYRAEKNPGYLRRYDIIMESFRAYLQSHSGWFQARFPEHRQLTIAYFSMEYGLHHALPFYAGGLGFLAGDHLKECSDLAIPLVGVGFMYSGGYLHQHISPDGLQESIQEDFDWDSAPIHRVRTAAGDQMVVRVPCNDPPIYVAVWRVDVGRVPLYLLDTDIPENDPANRVISQRLYTANPEERIRQEIVLGIGGRKVLSDLGVSFSAIHLNEGHPAYAVLEGIREQVELGVPFATALENERDTTVFTTHTPLPAGTDIFDNNLVDHYFQAYYSSLGIDREQFLDLGRYPGDPDRFNMSALAFRISHHHNGVSRRHAEVTREMWRSLWPGKALNEIPIDAITNGVHIPTWQNPRIGALIDQVLGTVDPRWMEDPDDLVIWELVDEIPDRHLWETHMRLKIKLFNRIRERKRMKWALHQDSPSNLIAEALLLNPSTLTIGIARRFSAYKRADLLFQDPARLCRIMNNPWYPVQFIFAGKAHPADNEGKHIIQRIYQFAQRPECEGRIAFVEDYGEQTAQYLVHGVDVWLNTPLPPLEACGTSGMKAALNGVLNLSILDGWWIEGFNEENGWAFGGGPHHGNRNATDADALYTLLEQKVIPLYYDTNMDGVPVGWVRMMKNSIKSVTPRFCTRRMVKEYVEKYYPSLLTAATKKAGCLVGKSG